MSSAVRMRAFENPYPRQVPVMYLLKFVMLFGAW